MSVAKIIFAGFSITITKKITGLTECKFKLAGDDILKFGVMVTSCLAGTVGTTFVGIVTAI